MGWRYADEMDGSITLTLKLSLVGPTRLVCSPTGMAAAEGLRAVHRPSHRHSLPGRRRQLSQQLAT